MTRRFVTGRAVVPAVALALAAGCPQGVNTPKDAAVALPDVVPEVSDSAVSLPDTGAPPCVSDPADLGLQPDGDPSLDLYCVTTGVSTTGQAWVLVEMGGPWLPSAAFYSWFATVTLTGAAGAIGSYTRQRHDGVDDTLVSGAVTVAQTTLTIQPGGANGFLVVFAGVTPGEITSVTVDSGMLKTSTSPFLSDQVIVDPFDSTVRDP